MPQSSLHIDATPYVRKRIDGVGRYSWELLRALKSLNPKIHLVFVGFIDDDFTEIQQEFTSATIKKIPVPRRLWSLVYKSVPAAFRLFNSNQQFLYTNFAQFPYFSKNSLLVIHDFAFIDRPQDVSLRNRKYLSRLVPISAANSKFVIGSSDYTSLRIAKELNTPINRIHTISNAINRSVFSAPRKTTQSLPQKFLLCVGTIEPRKNLPKTLDAYEMLPKRLTKNYPLVVVGKLGWKHSEIEEKISSMREDGLDIVTLGYVPDSELPAIYKKASVLVFPSLYEGFGLPILEAQATGTPVITSDIEPMKTIAGKGAVLIEPGEPKSISEAIEKILTNAKFTKSIVKNGQENTKNYTWEASAQKLLELLEESA